MLPMQRINTAGEVDRSVLIEGNDIDGVKVRQLDRDAIVARSSAHGVKLGKEAETKKSPVRPKTHGAAATRPLFLGIAIVGWLRGGRQALTECLDGVGKMFRPQRVRILPGSLLRFEGAA